MPGQEVLLQFMNVDQTILSPLPLVMPPHISKWGVCLMHKVPAQTGFCPEYVTMTQQKFHKFSPPPPFFPPCKS
jgi:hypothetical protein